MECPAAPVGHTAAKCQAVTGSGLYDVRVTAGRSLENALPWRLLDRLRPQSTPLPSATLTQLEAATAYASRFANFKRGMFGHDIQRLGQTPCAVFWSAARIGLGRPPTPACCASGWVVAHVGSCSEHFVAGYGTSTLADAEVWLGASSGSTARHVDYISSPDAAEWQDLGKWVAEYGLGMPPRRL